MPYHKGQPTPEENENYAHVARNIQKALDAKGWTGRDFNRETGRELSSASIYMWLSGKSGPGNASQKELAKVLGIPIEQVTPKWDGRSSVQRAVRDTAPKRFEDKKSYPLPDVARFGHIAAALRGVLEKQKISASELGRRVGSGNSVPSVWLNARGAPSAEYREKLHKQFGVPMENLIAKEPVNASPLAEKPRQPATAAPERVFTFTLMKDGQARLVMDATMPVERAWPLLQMLARAGVADIPFEETSS